MSSSGGGGSATGTGTGTGTAGTTGTDDGGIGFIDGDLGDGPACIGRGTAGEPTRAHEPPFFCWPCAPWLQDCDDGQKCVPSWPYLDWTECTALSPDPAPAGAPCESSNDEPGGYDTCDGWSMCWDLDPDTGTGTCVPFCVEGRAGPVCPAGLRCYMAVYDAVSICLPPCDPLAPDCGEGEGCFAHDTAVGTVEFYCRRALAPADLSPGTPCSDDLDCAPGQHCGLHGAQVCGAPDDGCCSPYCDAEDPGADAACAAALGLPAASCVPAFAPGVVGPDLGTPGACRAP